MPKDAIYNTSLALLYVDATPIHRILAQTCTTGFEVCHAKKCCMSFRVSPLFTGCYGFLASNRSSAYSQANLQEFVRSEDIRAKSSCSQDFHPAVFHSDIITNYLYGCEANLEVPKTEK